MRAIASLSIFALATLVAGASDAQSDDELIEELVTRTIDICVGPRDLAGVGLEETLEILALAPFKNCIKACRGVGKTCRSVVKSEDKCGKIVLKGTAKAALAICSDSICRSVVKSRGKRALLSYLTESLDRYSSCSQDEIACYGVCAF